MPVITLEGPSLSKGKREEIVKGFTEVAAKAMPQIPKQAFVVLLKENADDNVGVGGALLSELKKG
ncbi:MAG: 4-oxalocrotonate tautomerase DmpI [bacterium]